MRAVTHQPPDQIRPLDARRKLEVLPELTDSADFQTLATLFKRVKNIARELPRRLRRPNRSRPCSPCRPSVHRSAS